jgi:hypothetical protein
MAIKVTGNIVIDDTQAISNITTISSNGNANLGNLGTATAIITTGNVTTINSGLLQNGNSNITLTAGGNLTFTARTVSTLVVSNTGANITGTANVSGNANVLNLGTAQVLATANVTAPQLISNIATGTAPFVVTSTTTVSNLSVTSLQGNGPSQTATANSIVQRNVDGNITANFFVGNGSQLTGVGGGLPIANGTSNINIPASGGNINFSVGGSANEAIVTSTGFVVNGTIDATGNITVPVLISNVATGTAPLTVTSTTQVANLSVATAGSATTAGTVTTAAQPNITSTGSLTNTQTSSLGVGTAASGTTGEIRATNNITAYYSSDIRLKENIKNIENSLDLLKQIRGVNFDWTEDFINRNGGEDGYFIRKNDVGVIAQEVQAVLPQVVAKRSDDYLAVRYEKIIPLLIEAIKELSETIDELKRERN